MKNLSVIIVLLTVLSFPVCGGGNAASAGTPPWEKGLDGITEENSRMYVEVLAADSLEGRRAGLPGAVAASEHIADWLEEIGAVPFLEDSYFQTFDNAQMSERIGAQRRVPPGIVVRNILAKIEGINPDEYVVIGAHYDHVGIQPGVQEDDKIFNGADDNASGVAGVLQIARGFAASGVKPQRTVVFAFWDAEEMGLVGSRCFGQTFEEMDKVRAYLNLDMIGRDDVGEDRVAYFSTDSIPYVRFAAEDIAAYGLGIEPVTDPEILGRDFYPMVFVRDGEGRKEAVLPGNSDYAPFQMAGIPVYMMSTGAHPDYHRPGDEANKIDYPKMTEISKMAFLTLYRLANPGAEITYPAGEDIE